MRLTHLPIELTAMLYMLAYVPYILIVRALATISDKELGRPLTGLETLPAVLIMSSVMLFLFAWSSGWWRSANRITVGGWRMPFPNKWTFLAGLGTAILLFTVPLSLTFKNVSIPFVQLLMRGDVLIVAPIVDLISGRKVRWYSWVALVMVSIALSLSLWERGGLHMPPLAIAAVVLYTIGYFMRLAAMTRVAKNEREDSLRGYFVEEKIVGMPFTLIFLMLITISPLGNQANELTWGFVNVWSSAALPWLIVMAVAFFAIAIFSALILLDPRENTFCVPFERAATILAGTIAAYLLAILFGQPLPTTVELVGVILLVAAIALLSLAPRWGKPVPASQPA